MTIIDPIFEVDLDTSDFIDVAISLELSGGGASSWGQIKDKPFEKIGDTLKVRDGVLDINIYETTNDGGGITVIIGE